MRNSSGPKLHKSSKNLISAVNIHLLASIGFERDNFAQFTDGYFHEQRDGALNAAAEVKIEYPYTVAQVEEEMLDFYEGGTNGVLWFKSGNGIYYEIAHFTKSKGGIAEIKPSKIYLKFFQNSLRNLALTSTLRYLLLLHLVPDSHNGHAKGRKRNRLSQINTVDTINFALALNKLDEAFLEEYGEILSSQMKGMDYPKKHSQNLRLLVSYLASKATVHGKRKMRLQGGLIEKVENAKDKQARLRQEAMAEKKKKKELEKIAKALEKEKQKRLMDEKIKRGNTFRENK